MIPRNKHPQASPWYNIHDVSQGSISTDEFLYRWARNDFFSLKFVGRSKYCLEISQTWEKLSSSHILYFLFLRSSSARMEIEFERIYWPQANIGNSFFFTNLQLYLRFSEVEFSKFYYQHKTIIVKKGFLKISV